MFGTLEKHRKFKYSGGQTHVLLTQKQWSPVLLPDAVDMTGK